MRSLHLISALLLSIITSSAFAFTGAYGPQNLPENIDTVTIKVTNIALDGQCGNFEFCFRAFVWLNGSEEANASFPVSPGMRTNKTPDGNFDLNFLSTTEANFSNTTIKACTGVNGNPETADGSLCLKATDAGYLFNWIEQAGTRGTSLLVEDMDKILIPQRQTFNGNEAVQVEVNISQQRLRLWINDVFMYEWKVSTGAAGYGTPATSYRPNGRVYTKYSSSKYPGGNYVDPQGRSLGNMPYAMFYRGGLAIHGTPRGNWSKLGRRASHGCTRVHPDNAKLLNQLVRDYGVDNVRFTHYY